MLGKKGRPSKLDGEVAERLTHAIRLGSTYQLACKYAGISYQTFLNWKEKASSASSGVFFDLFEAIARAEGEAAVGWLELIEKNATDNPQWAAWKLERRYPRDYGRTIVENRNIDMSKLSDDELRAIAEG